MSLNKNQAAQISEKLKEKLIIFSFLAKGNHNNNYLVETNKRKYVVRIENNCQFNNLKKEYLLLKSLKPNLGPKVYFFDKTHKIIHSDYFVEEFIEGKHPTLLDDKFIFTMAKWLKKLHKQKKSCKKYSLLNAIKPYARNVNSHKDALTPNLYSKIGVLFDRVLAFCKKNNDIFSNRKTNSLLHRDLSRDNIIYDGKKIKLLDWEFSNYDFPEWDITYFIKSFKLDKDKIKYFLKNYRYPNSKSDKKRLLIISMLNTCGDMGYSVWRMDLVKQGKLKKSEKISILTRLKKDIKLLEKTIEDLESQDI